MSAVKTLGAENRCRRVMKWIVRRIVIFRILFSSIYVSIEINLLKIIESWIVFQISFCPFEVCHQRQMVRRIFDRWQSSEFYQFINWRQRHRLQMEKKSFFQTTTKLLSWKRKLPYWVSIFHPNSRCSPSNSYRISWELSAVCCRTPIGIGTNYSLQCFYPSASPKPFADTAWTYSRSQLIDPVIPCKKLEFSPAHESCRRVHYSNHQQTPPTLHASVVDGWWWFGRPQIEFRWELQRPVMHAICRRRAANTDVYWPQSNIYRWMHCATQRCERCYATTAYDWSPVHPLSVECRDLDAFHCWQSLLSTLCNLPRRVWNGRENIHVHRLSF